MYSVEEKYNIINASLLFNVKPSKTISFQIMILYQNFIYHFNDLFWKLLTVLMSPDRTKHMSTIVKIKKMIPKPKTKKYLIINAVT